ncbi:MAG: type IV pilus twitching motility protein PilT, partial [Myxococcota bacterium]
MELISDVLSTHEKQELEERGKVQIHYSNEQGIFRCQIRLSPEQELRIRFTVIESFLNDPPTDNPLLTVGPVEKLSSMKNMVQFSSPTNITSPLPINPSLQGSLPPNPSPHSTLPVGISMQDQVASAHLPTGAIPIQPPSSHSAAHTHTTASAAQLTTTTASTAQLTALSGDFSAAAAFHNTGGWEPSEQHSTQEIRILSALHSEENRTSEREIDRLFKLMVRERSSDLHISSGERPMIRVDGGLKRIDKIPPLDGTQVAQLLSPILPPRNLQEFTETLDTDFAYELPGTGRFRANIFMDRIGIGAVFRLIPSEIITAEQLKLPACLRDLCYLSKGLVLVTGPTGSGKSTTLCALIDLINRERDDHIITIEDPIEFVHPNKKCLVNQREVGVHTQSFKAALRASLREDPDVILVGELRDLETISIAIETAETGHLVFGTLHTSSAVTTVDRMIDQFSGERQSQIRMMLSNSLKAVVSQTLLRRKQGGRIAAMEILLVTHGVSNLIREKKIHQIQSIMQTSKGLGMQCLNDVLLEYVAHDIVSVKDAYTKAIDKMNFVDLLTEAGIPTEGLG